jgi:hypothetical protein
MTERTAKYVVCGFAVLNAFLVPTAQFVNLSPFNSTFFAGGTLVSVYLAANPRLLVANRDESKQTIRQETTLPIALVLGSILMLLAIAQAVIRGGNA